jgi:hypothetical protein
VSNLQLMLIVGGVITTLLAIYASVLAVKLKQKAKLRSQPVEFQTKSQSQLDAQLSIRVIAQALLQNDLSSTEAAMRIGFLAQQLTEDFKQDKSIKVFQDLAMEASHLPILDAWKALPKDEKNRLEKERLSIESQYAEQVQLAAKALATLN